ncbi:MAG: HAD hydrolase-like protein, partial [Hyphomicrobiaceae bacterium]
DGIVTSGDVSRELIRSWSGQNVYHIGPERDLPLFDGTGVRLCRAEDAEVLVCTGLRDDETETPDDYADVLGLASRNELEMICANPDLKVERAGKIVWCAGGVAAAYAALGGRVVYAGKPYLPIYDMAMDRVAEFRGGAVDMRRVLAIGDGVNTDIAGAIAAGLRSLYIASPVHMDAGAALTGEAVAALFASLPGAPVAAMARLSW